MSFRHFPRGLSGRGRSRVPRPLAVILFALQALLWSGGSIADARGAAESLSRYAHVEDQSTTACPPIHSHLDCLICRTFAAGAITSRSRELVPRATRAVSMPNASTVGTRGEGCTGPLGSRAPPTL